MNFTKKEFLASRNSSAQVLMLISVAMIVVSFAIQTTEAAPGLAGNDRRIYRKQKIEYYRKETICHYIFIHYQHNAMPRLFYFSIQSKYRNNFFSKTAAILIL